MYLYGVDKKSSAAVTCSASRCWPTQVRSPAPIALSLVNRPDVSEDETLCFIRLKAPPRRGEGLVVGVIFLPCLRVVLWSCSSAVSASLGLSRRLGSLVVVGPTYAGKAAFVK